MTPKELNERQIEELEAILVMIKNTEQKARGMCELSTTIAWKYQQRMREIRKAKKQLSK